MSVITMRRAAARDAVGIRALIAGVYAEHGDRLRLDGAEQDLRDVRQAYPGAFLVLERDGEIVGTHALEAVSEAVCTFRRLYLHADLRGGPWGRQLMQWAVDRARREGFRRVEFWSDTRFTRAHRFFRKLGFESDGRRRQMEDGHEPYAEYFFSLDLD